MSYAYWRGGRVWIGWTDSAGVRHRDPSALAKNLTQGKEEAAELQRRSKRQGKGLEPELGKDTLFRDRALQWLSELPGEYRSKDTAETYLRQRILPFIGEVPCRSMTREHVRGMLRANELGRDGLDSKGNPIKLKPAQPATREKLRAYVHTIFEWLIEDLEVVGGRNPAGGKRMRIKAPKRLARYIPLAELVQLLRAIPDHYRLLFVFGVVSGVRKGELIPLLWPDVNLDERLIFITKSRGWDTTKGKKERVVAIPKWLVPAFEAERERKWSQLVFPNVDGKRHRFDVKLTKVMRVAAKRAGLITGYSHVCRRKGCTQEEEILPDSTPRQCPKCRFLSWVEGVPKQYIFRDLRSTFGTLATAESGDIRYVQQVLGHESVRTTEGHYVRALTADMVRKTDALTSFRGLAPIVSNLCAEGSGDGPNGVKRSDVELPKC